VRITAKTGAAEEAAAGSRVASDAPMAVVARPPVLAAVAAVEVATASVKEEAPAPIGAAQASAQPAVEPPETTTTVAPQEAQPLGAREVSFNIEAPQAREIYLVGDFNHWKINDDSRLSRRVDGRWEKRVELSPGRYKYKYIVDGEWTVDGENSEREQNAFGTFDSIIKL
jgi:5'-AMP-activated protein kinase regulatory beta subunit